MVEHLSSIRKALGLVFSPIIVGGLVDKSAASKPVDLRSILGSHRVERDGNPHILFLPPLPHHGMCVYTSIHTHTFLKLKIIELESFQKTFIVMIFKLLAMTHNGKL